MALARSFNKLKNRRHVRFRDEQYRNLAALLDANGAPATPRIELKDGYAIDTSHALPHLDRMIADAQTIIEERRGVVRGGGSRQHFQQLITNAYIERFPSVLDFAASSDVLQSVIGYLGFIPTLSAAKPLGVRLAESSMDYVPDWDGQYRASQLFHCDYHDRPMVYVIVCLRDVTPECGPFSFLSRSVSERAMRELGYHRRGRPYRVADEDLYKVVDRKELVELAYPKGTVLFIDSANCFHYGSRGCVQPRYLMMYAYVSVARTDFTDLLRKEATRPLADLETRDKRHKYPVRDGDPVLRKLIVDREYAG
jgi:hypothetical protein